MFCRKYSFQRLTQFTQGNNVPYYHASKTDGFLLSNSCLSSTYLNRPIWSKQTYLHLVIPKLKKVFIEKHTQFSLGNNAVVTPLSKKDGFLSRNICVPST
jgi:hypothetical protein